MFQLVKDVDEFAAGEAAKQQTIVVAVLRRTATGTITSTLAVVRAGATDQPAGSVAAALEGNSDLLGTHRDTAKARLAMA